MFTQLKDVSLAVCRGAFFFFSSSSSFPFSADILFSLQSLNLISRGLFLGVDVSFLIY